MIEPWMTKLSREYGCCIAAKLGDSGSLVYGGEALHHVPIVPVRATDTTGAGDGFCGGFLAGLVDGRSPTECAAMGSSRRPLSSRRGERWRPENRQSGSAMTGFRSDLPNSE